MLDSIITSHTNHPQSHFWREHVKILPSFSQEHYEHHYVTLINLQNTSGLSILVHGVISLPNEMLCDSMSKSMRYDMS